MSRNNKIESITTAHLPLGTSIVASKQVPSSEVITSTEYGQTFQRTGEDDASALTTAIRQALQTCPLSDHAMRSRHQHIENFQSQHLASTEWLCRIVS